MNFSETQNKKILLAALDWGFGHVTRSIGIIHELLAHNNQITIACNKEQEQLFKSYFPHLNYVFLDGYNLTFGGKGNWGFDLWKQRKKFRQNISKEKKFVADYLINNEIDLLISDHRYGFYSNKVESVFITHQIHLPLSKLYYFVQKWHESKLIMFSKLWILDDEKSSLAGKLSERINHPDFEFIGWKSRFQISENFSRDITFDYLLVLSGPSPYCEKLLVEVQQKIDFKNKVVAVIYPPNLKIEKNDVFTYFACIDLYALDYLFFQSKIIVSRSGYSTLMDLKYLQKDSILLPTKGQKEQEYLFQLHAKT